MIRAVILAGLLLATGCRRRFDNLPDGPASGGDVGGDTGDAVVCAHTFCDNFDRPGPVTAGWDDVDLAGSASQTQSTAQWKSAPNGYQVVIDQSNVDRAFLIKQLPAPASQIVIDLWLGWASTNPTTAEVDLVALQWDTPPGTCTSFGFYLVRDGTTPFNLQETYAGTNCTPSVQNYKAVLDNTGMHHFVMTITLGTPGHITILQDGVSIHDLDTARPVPSSTLTLKVGGGSSRNLDPLAPWTITYDDIYVDIN